MGARAPLVIICPGRLKMSGRAIPDMHNGQRACHRYRMTVVALVGVSQKRTGVRILGAVV